MKTITTTVLLLLMSFFLCAHSVQAVHAAQDTTFQKVELDQFIEQQKSSIKGNQKVITMAAPVSFTAKMKRFPEEKVMNYIYQAMEVSGVTPMPEVHHRMFIESAGGRIIPVYVEMNTVEKLQKGLKEEQKANFIGYHVYNYAKGPAILVVDFNPAL